jgi:hypothetical protein
LNSNFFLFIVGLVIARHDSDLRPSIQGHETAAVSNVDDVGGIVDYHDDGGARARALWAYLLPWHGLLGSSLSRFNERYEISLTFINTCGDGLFRVLWEVLILHNEVVEVVS